MKGNFFSIALTSAALLLATSIQAAPLLSSSAKIKPYTHQIFKPLPSHSCPDLAANLQVMNIQKQSNGSYSFNLVARVINRGNAAYISRPNQQFAMLSENHLGAGSRNLNRVSISGNVRPGGGSTLVHRVRNFNLSTEFLPGYTLAILYGPDIRIDGNPRNDDCISSNNIAHIGGEAVRRIINRSAAATVRAPYRHVNFRLGNVVKYR